MKNYLILFFTSFYFLAAQAQLTPAVIRDVYDTAAIMQYKSFRFKLNGNKLSRRELRNILLSVPESAEEYRAYRKMQKISNGLLIGAGATYVSSFFVLPLGVNAAMVLMGSTLALSIAAAPPGVKAKEHLLKAVWIYNRERLAKSAGS
jgi:hypothetical protein